METLSEKTSTVKDKDGNVLQNKDDRLNRWKQHFQEVLNREHPRSPLTEEETEGPELEISSEPPSRPEIRKALKQMRNGKSPGVDAITTELLTADEETTVEEMKRIIDLIWTKEKTPRQWNKGLICKIREASLCFQ